MRVNDVQLGAPQVLYKDTKANIQSMTVESGAFAYATDTSEMGYYDGSTWHWYSMPTSGTVIVGSGTANTIPKFTGANAIGNSSLTESNVLTTSSLKWENNSPFYLYQLRFIASTDNVEEFTSTTPSGYSWATGTGWVTPTVSISKEFLRATGVSTTDKSFFYRSAPTFSTFMAFVSAYTATNGFYFGIRLDDEDTNYVECNIKYDTTATFRYVPCININGTETAFTTFMMPNYNYGMYVGFNRSGSSWSSWSAQLVLNNNSGISTVLNAGSTQTWTPTRIGWVTKWQGTSWNLSYIDFLKYS